MEPGKNDRTPTVEANVVLVLAEDRENRPANVVDTCINTMPQPHSGIPLYYLFRGSWWAGVEVGCDPTSRNFSDFLQFQ